MTNTREEAQAIIESASALIDATYGKSPIPDPEHPGYEQTYAIWEEEIMASRYPVWVWLDAMKLMIVHSHSTDHMPRLGDLISTVNGLSEDTRYKHRQKLAEEIRREQQRARARNTERIRQRAEEEWLRKQEEKAEQEKV